MLKQYFDMKNMGIADIILGIKIYKTSGELVLSQSHYIEDVLRKFDVFDSPPIKSPMNMNHRIDKNRGAPVFQERYTQVICSLMYITNCTRPDIAYPVNKLAMFTRNLGNDHWKTLNWILRHLKYSLTYRLHYSIYPSVLEGYNDANWISDIENTKSTSGYVFTIGGGVLSWKSSKQTCIARCTMKSEFIILDNAGEEVE
ncbi:hypothetical protein RND71_040480 [Anisodus tanguticus]|uniref:Reverse transcriptase Ty1/copia-type domain-containing protein n=1 Tax=Anisodus tanguticus TaxID=243964 RepID=A0AAE1QU67_9SOLA|nr:hypothetical protein RND71_040480 [Anisodus tanguticus]